MAQLPLVDSVNVVRQMWHCGLTVKLWHWLPFDPRYEGNTMPWFITYPCHYEAAPHVCFYITCASVTLHSHARNRGHARRSAYNTRFTLPGCCSGCSTAWCSMPTRLPSVLCQRIFSSYYSYQTLLHRDMRTVIVSLGDCMLGSAMHSLTSRPQPHPRCLLFHRLLSNIHSSTLLVIPHHHSRRSSFD